MVGKGPSRGCLPVCQVSCVPWSLWIVHSERTTAMSSAQVPTCCHQSATSSPDWPYFLTPVLRPINTLRLPWAGLPARTFLSRSELRASLYGVSSIVLPAYLFSSSFG